MKCTHFLKQGLAVLLSLSMSFSPAAPSFASFMAYAAGDGLEAPAPGSDFSVSASPSSAVKAENGDDESSASTASSSDALYDEDGFLLDGEVQNDVPAEDTTRKDVPDEELPAQETPAVNTDGILLQAEAEGILVTVRSDKGVLPENVTLEAELVDPESAEQEEIIRNAFTETKDASVLKLHFLDENGEETEPDRTAGRIFVTFSGIERPVDEKGSFLPDEELAVFGMKDAGDEKAEELEKLQEEEDLLLTGALLSSEGSVINDLQDSGASGAENGGGDEDALAETASATVEMGECALFLLTWSIAGAILNADSCTVTFDYGFAPVWEQDGVWHSIHDGQVSGHADRESAEQDAVSVLTFTFDPDYGFSGFVPAPKGLVESEGEQYLFQGWRSDAGEELSTSEWPYFYSSGDVTYHAIWSSDFYKLTFDYGQKLIWEDNGSYLYAVIHENGYGINRASDREEALNKASSEAVYYVSSGSAFNHDIYCPDIPVEVGGQLQLLNGWQSESGEFFDRNDIWYFVPQGDTVFSACWTADYYTVTVDYGEKAVWEEDEMWCAVSDNGGYSGLAWYSDQQSAEENAVEQFTGYVAAGNSIDFYVARPRGMVTMNGQTRMMTGWQTDGGEVIPLDLSSYIPTSDVTLTPVWTTEYPKVTFDYGILPVWEKDGLWYSVHDGQVFEHTDRGSAEQDAAAVNEYLFDPSEWFNAYVPAPKGTVESEGIQYVFRGWRSDAGEELGTNEWPSINPSGGETYHAIWSSDFHKVTFDYGQKLVWEDNGSYHYAVFSENSYNTYSTENFEDALNEASSEAVYYVDSGSGLSCSLFYPNVPVEVGGQPQLMTGWKSESGEFFDRSNYWDFVPEEDTVFSACWTADYYAVTVDYGEKLVWEEDESWRAVEYNDGSSIINWYSDQQYAEDNAVEQFTGYVVSGIGIEFSVGRPSGIVTVNGQTRMMTGWQTDGGEVLSLDLSSYIPTSDVTLIPVWTTEYPKVTFDYGILPVWEKDGLWYSVHDGQVFEYADRGSAEQDAAAVNEYLIEPSMLFNGYVPAPKGAVESEGTRYVFKGWRSDTGEELGTDEWPSIYPSGGETYHAIWNSDFYKVTFDYGQKLVWEDNGSCRYVVFSENSYHICDTDNLEEALREASSEAVYYVDSGSGFSYSLFYPSVPVEVGGQLQLITGWKSESGEFFDRSDILNSVPEEDAVFNACWTTDYYAVTVDYGEKLFWEEDGNWVSIRYEDGFSSICGTGDRQSAEEIAVAQFTGYVLAGRGIEFSAAYPTNMITMNGQSRMMTGWQTDGGEVLPLDLFSYVPTSDVTLTPVWTTEIYYVTFDFGEKLVWEYDGSYCSFRAENSSITVYYYGTREEAEMNAARSVTFPVAAGTALRRSIGYPYSVVLVDGQPRFLSGWQGSNGEVLGLDSVYDYVPSSDVTFTPKWDTEIWTTIFDYGSPIVWAEGNRFACIIADSYNSSIGYFETRAEAEEKAAQSLTYYTLKGSQLDKSIPFPTSGAVINGTAQIFKEWRSDSGVTLQPYGTYSYTPEADMTFRAQWDTDVYLVTFDYGTKMFWEDNGYYYYADPYGSMGWSADAESAEESAVSSAQRIVHQGDRLHSGPACPAGGMNVDGSLKMLTGWRTASGEVIGRGKIYSYIPSGDTVFTAVWSETVTVTLHENNGGEEQTVQQTVARGGIISPGIGLAYGFRKEGQLIYGWSTDRNAVQDKPEYKKFVAESDIDLYAVWGEAVVVRLDPDGGELEYGDSEFLEFPGSGFYLLDYRAYKEGYEFIGWENKSTGELIHASEIQVTEDITLKARYGKLVEIFYVENYQGSTDRVARTETEGWEIKATRRYQRDGAIIIGYSTDPNASEPEIPIGSYFRVQEGMVLYSIWAEAYTLTLDFNGGHMVEEGYDVHSWNEEELQREADKPVLSLANSWVENLSNNYYALVNGDQILSGWAFDPEGTRMVTEEDLLTGNTTIYAQWTDGYRVVIQYVEGSFPADFYEGQYEEPEKILVIPKGSSLTEPGMIAISDSPFAVKGYKSNGVLFDTLEGVVPTGNVTYKTNLIRTADQLVKLTFHSAESAEVREWDSRGSAFCSWDDPDYYGEEKLVYRYAVKGETLNNKVLSLPEINSWRSNEVFKGWSTVRGGTDPVDFETRVFTEDTDLYPILSDGAAVTFILGQQTGRPVSYEVPREMRVDSGTDYVIVLYEKGDVLSYPEDSSMKTSGLFFQGWYRTADFSGEAIHIPDSGVTAENGMVLYAKWGEQVNVTGVTISKTTNEVTEGDSFVLTAKVVPDDATNKKVSWSSSDPQIVTVDQTGKVTAVKAGSARVTVTTEDGSKTAYCNVTVKAKDLKSEFIRRLYRTCMNREADSGGLAYWLDLINTGKVKGIALAGSFVFSKEFTGRNYCNEHFVRQIYPALMGRQPDSSGFNYWVSQLDKGMKREELLNQFASSKEYQGLCEAAGFSLGEKYQVPQYGTQQYGPCAVCGSKSKVVQFVERMYTECLGRAAESGGLKYWSEALCKHNQTAKSLLHNFFLSQEIKNKNLSNEEYVRRIYKAMMNRSPDSGGLKYWKERLDKGDSPAVVVNSFIDSSEFTQICNDYGIQRQ